MERRKIIVISIDALITSDIPYLRKSRNIGRLMERSAVVENSLCIYPTITYPCHASIMTGCWPGKHGIHQNTLFEVNPDGTPWYFRSRDIKVPGMFDYFKAAGYTTASVAWPVMGSNPAIDHRITEIWPRHRADDPMPLHVETDSPDCLDIVEKYKHLLDHSSGTAYDNFATPCSVEIIERFRPDFMCIHLSHLDSHRHANGYETERNLDAIEFIDGKIGQIVDAVRRNGDYDNTTFVLLGDHGQMNVHNVFCPNVWLARNGYITLDENGKVADWRIFDHGAGFSGHVHIQNIGIDEAKAALERMKAEFPSFVERVMDKFAVDQLYHLSGPFEFVIEGCDNVAIADSVTGEIVRDGRPDETKYYRGSHGYAPEKGTNPPFIICGSQAQDGKVIAHGRLIDVAPTILKLAGLEMPTADGTAYDMIV